nr:TraY domain-containing protein [uncultured Acidovorax sp.]
MDTDKFKARDVQPTVLRLHPDVRAELVRIAFVNGRSLSKEIAVRLEASLKSEVSPLPEQQAAGRPDSYTATKTATVLHTENDKGPVDALSGTDQAMLDVFRALPPEKQLALLSLFR